MGVPIRDSTAVSTFNAGGGTSHLAALPATVLTGDRVLAQVVAVDPATTVTTPSGWTSFGADNTGGSGNSGQIAKWYYRDATGSEGGGNVDWVTSADVDVIVTYIRYLAGSVAATAPELAVANNGASPNPPSLDPSGWAGEPTAWIAGWSRFASTPGSSVPPEPFTGQVTGDTTGTNSVGCANAFVTTFEATSFNPGIFSIPESGSVGAVTVAVRGQDYVGIPGVGWRANSAAPSSTATTTFTLTIPAAVQTGDDLYVPATSRDHTAGTGLATLTDDDTGGNTWTLLTNSTDRKGYLWWKKATAATAGKTVTFAGGVGSSTGGLTAFYGGIAGDPTTNLALEDNASGNETHAGFTPTTDSSMVCFLVINDSNDLPVTALNSANMGSLEEAFWENVSTGGSDCAVIFTGRQQLGTATATGSFTWTQGNAVSISIGFAIAPAAATVTGTGASTLDDVTSAGTGSVNLTATGSSLLDGVTSAGTGIVAAPVTGTGASTLDGVTSVGSGNVIAPVSGSGSSTLQGVTSAGTGTLGIDGTGASTLDGVVSAGSGVVANPVVGTGTSTLDGVASSGVGEVLVQGKIENVVCDLVGVGAVCDELAPACTGDIYGPVGVSSITP